MGCWLASCCTLGVSPSLTDTLYLPFRGGSSFACVVLSGHWCSCIWRLQVELFADDAYSSWLGVFGFCAAPGFVNASDAGFTVTTEDGIHCNDEWTVYAVSLYWAIMTITSIGYGDIHPTRPSEQVTAVAVMLVTSMVWGYVIATFCGVISTMQPEVILFKQNMDDLVRGVQCKGHHTTAATTATTAATSACLIQQWWRTGHAAYCARLLLREQGIGLQLDVITRCPPRPTCRRTDSCLCMACRRSSSCGSASTSTRRATCS